jgi:N-acetylglucosamine kinase-like BadF-type ATPase
LKTVDVILAVAGGSRVTEAVIATTKGEILGRGLGPSSNMHRVGIEKARAALETAIEGALLQMTAQGTLDASAIPSWVQSGRIQAACFGMSGVNGADEQAAFSSWLKGLGCRFPFSIGNDSELILNGGTPESWGIALISGTGSICLGRTPEGRTARVGGWGYIMGDEGSGYRVGAEALGLATQAADGRGGSPSLLKAALAHFAATEPERLIAVIYGPKASADDVAAFGGRVLDLARNDPAAAEIVDHAARALALHVDTVAGKLGLTKPPLALNGAMIRTRFKNLVLEKITTPLGPVDVVLEPLHGALISARRMLRAG